ncbi:MAG: 16S rRNA (adenine1518-N6/adenine1519-N6)-dimethyltransferase [Parcubacteria group bacterium LiPW_41]|nr:MAG: 16S rRNA (adenine1518-N6/adenine1519-N6)-dimethyltransferase [Parcubacteria group bacterium LiPW_41]
MRQKLGQHFLKNKETLSFIALHTNIKKGDTLIEIGPGHGELTNFLISETQKCGASLYCIEKDTTFFENIEKLLTSKTQKNKLFRGDVREILPTLPKSEKINNYALVGNIPYYLTSFLFRIISELPEKPHTITLLIQKEVAERLVQKPPKQNLLSMIISSFADAKIIKRVSRGQFSPPPKVDSAVIQLVTHNRYTQKEIDIYIKTVKIAFSQPRKTIYNNIRDKKNELDTSEKEIASILLTLGIKENARAQTLDKKNMMALAKMLYNEK